MKLMGHENCVCAVHDVQMFELEKNVSIESFGCKEVDKSTTSYVGARKLENKKILGNQ